MKRSPKAPPARAAGRARPAGRARRAIARAALAAAGFAGAGLPPAALATEATAASPSPPPARVYLDYRRDPSARTCISAAQLAADVESRLGRPVFVPPAGAELTARVVARRAGGRFVVDVRLFDRRERRLGQRELSTRARHCSALDDSLALVLSLAADMPREPEVPDGTGNPEQAADVARGSNESGLGSRSLGTPLAIPETSYAPRAGVQVRPSLGVAALAGPLPSLAPGLELGVELRMHELWPVAIRGSAWAGQRHELEAIGGGARFSALALAFSVCPYQVALGGFEASVCAEQWLGRVQADGFGVGEAQRTTRWLLAFGAGAALTRELGPVFVSASAELLVPVLRRRYLFTDVTDITLYEEPWVQAAGALRVGTEF
jgi:hypothetical protein